jgi:hypothetical protein
MEARGLIGDEGPALGYETALEELLSLVGRRVEVTVISIDPLGVVAEFAGELTRGDDVHHPSRTEEGEAFRFAVGAGNSFSVESRLFRRASWIRAGATTGSLRLYLGAAAVEVWAEEPGELRSKLPDGGGVTAALFGLLSVLVGGCSNGVVRRLLKRSRRCA